MTLLNVIRHNIDDSVFSSILNLENTINWVSASGYTNIKIIINV